MPTFLTCPNACLVIVNIPASVNSCIKAVLLGIHTIAIGRLGLLQVFCSRYLLTVHYIQDPDVISVLVLHEIYGIYASMYLYHNYKS